MSNTSVTTVIDLLRHGEVEGGAKYRGQQDDPLTETGWQQLQATTKNTQNWQQVISSPLKRCSAFAQALANEQGIPFSNNNNFSEIDFGEWEGKTADELLSSDPELINQYWHDPVNTSPPGGEVLADFKQRILSAWESLLDEQKGKHILLVTHAGVIRIILCHILGMSLKELFKIDVALAKATRIQLDSDGKETWPRLIFHGCEFS